MSPAPRRVRTLCWLFRRVFFRETFQPVPRWQRRQATHPSYCSQPAFRNPLRPTLLAGEGGGGELFWLPSNYSRRRTDGWREGGTDVLQTGKKKWGQNGIIGMKRRTVMEVFWRETCLELQFSSYPYPRVSGQQSNIFEIVRPFQLTLGPELFYCQRLNPAAV